MRTEQMTYLLQLELPESLVLISHLTIVRKWHLIAEELAEFGYPNCGRPLLRAVKMRSVWQILKRQES